MPTEGKKAPKSYRNRRRPPQDEALAAEGDVTIQDAVNQLVAKGYFEAPARPWKLGRADRGMGRGDYAVLDRFGDVVFEVKYRAHGEFVVAAVNAYKPMKDKKGKKK